MNITSSATTAACARIGTSMELFSADASSGRFSFEEAFAGPDRCRGRRAGLLRLSKTISQRGNKNPQAPEPRGRDRFIRAKGRKSIEAGCRQQAGQLFQPGGGDRRAGTRRPTGGGSG